LLLLVSSVPTQYHFGGRDGFTIPLFTSTVLRRLGPRRRASRVGLLTLLLSRNRNSVASRVIASFVLLRRIGVLLGSGRVMHRCLMMSLCGWMHFRSHFNQPPSVSGIYQK